MPACPNGPAYVNIPMPDRPRKRSGETARWSFALGRGEHPVEWDWLQGPPNVFGLGSVRRPQSHSRARHVPVRAYSVTTGTHLEVESGLEHDLVRVLDRRSDVTWLVAQPCRILFPLDVGRRTHVPDLLSLSTGGRVTLWDVRPNARADDLFWRQVAMTQRACADVGWGHEVFHGLDEVERLNLLWLQGFRHEMPWHERHVERLTGSVRSGEATIQDLIDLDDGSGEVIATMWHLMWCGQLKVVTRTRLTETSPVSVGGADA